MCFQAHLEGGRDKDSSLRDRTSKDIRGENEQDVTGEEEGASVAIACIKE